MKGSMRKIIQISNADNWVYALCDDGTMWVRPKPSTSLKENGQLIIRNSNSDQWLEHPGVPQPVEGQALTMPPLTTEEMGCMMLLRTLIDKMQKTNKVIVSYNDSDLLRLIRKS